MSEVTRGQVDNENNSQSQYSNISNNIQGEGLIYDSENIVKKWEILEYGLEHSKAMSTGRIAQECNVRIGTGTGMGTGTKL